MTHHQILIVGGGTAGLSIASLLKNKANHLQVTVIDPAEKHYYQPIWTLVGAGVFPREISERSQADYIPNGVNWIREYVDTFDPDNNTITLVNGENHSYDYLVVTAGIQLDWNKIPGLRESIGQPGSGVCSNYSYDTVSSTWDNIRNLKKGRAIFTQPNTAVKCGGAPQKITYLAAHHFQKSGLKNNIEVVFASAKGGIFPVQKYATTLNKVIEKRDIVTRFNHNLKALIPEEKKAIFDHLQTGDEIVMDYDMIHVTPPQSAPDFVKRSPLAAESGWISVDPQTLQHTTYENVFSCGDCSNLPTSKTGAAIRKQAPTLAYNLMANIEGKPMPESYDGYTSCPLVTGYGSLVLAEFDYEKKPKESFPFDQSQERYSMYALKAYALPKMYWHGMLKGREF